ncbi:MAG: cell division protein SepF, partial [Oscillospiraceae bacterium]|nr:cell division protein SepF [Oscillospiraceae bacterium]
ETETEKSDQMDGTYARSAAAYQAPQREKVVAFARPHTGYAPGEGTTREFPEAGGGFSSGGFGGSSAAASAASGARKNGAESADAYVVFKRLKDFPTATQVADRMTENKIVILNLESCDDDMARRVLDFIGGVAYACGAMVKRIAGRVFMITPKGINADGEFFDEIHGSAPGIKYDE